MSEWNKRLMSVTAVLAFLTFLIFTGKKAVTEVETPNVTNEIKNTCVVLDAGHGGMDPGKVGVDGIEEKNLNLEIVMKIRKYLAAEGIRVILTREADTELGDGSGGNRKVQDMKERIRVIETSGARLAVSIHQNSYPEEYVKGAQVFYYTDSPESQKLAALMQKNLIEKVDPENKRQMKGNDSYYLLKRTDIPIVIVESGFLTNRAEAKKLQTADYQDRIAWAVHMAILQYLNQTE